MYARVLVFVCAYMVSVLVQCIVVTELLFLQELNSVTGVLDALRDSAEKNLTELQEIKVDVEGDQNEVKGLLARGEEGRQVSPCMLLCSIAGSYLL